jgi:hypothetical protein
MCLAGIPNDVLEFGPLKSDLEVTLDNATRWNSAFLTIKRALRLKEPLKHFILTERELPQDDKLTDTDWDQLEGIYYGLKPFWEVTRRLQGHGLHGSHGVIWEALLVFDLLLSHLERKINEIAPPNQQVRRHQHTRGGGGRSRGRQVTQAQVINPLLVCCQNAWEVLQEYNELTDESHEIYAIAAIFNPCLRKDYFVHAWTDDARAQLQPMTQKLRKIYDIGYYQQLPRQPESIRHESSLDSYMDEFQQSHTERLQAKDDLERYLTDPLTPLLNWKTENLFAWWDSSPYPTLRQMAFDHLSVPAMSAELERVFSQSKRLWTADRNSLSPEMFEAAMCLKHWAQQLLHLIRGDGDDDGLSEAISTPIRPLSSA